MIYSMEIDAKVRRLVVDATLGNSGYQCSAHPWKALCALLFVGPKKNFKLVVNRLDSQAQSDSVVRPSAREALY